MKIIDMHCDTISELTTGAGNFGYFLILVIKAVGQSRFTSTDINSLCGVEIIKLAFIKVVALTIRDKFLFFRISSLSALW